MYEYYKRAQASYWTVEEVDLGYDMRDWLRLTDNERHFISYVLAFFAASDGIVLENLATRFMQGGHDGAGCADEARGGLSTCVDQQAASFLSIPRTARVHAHTHLHPCTRTRARVRARTHTPLHARTLARTHPCPHARARTHTHTCPHTAHTHTMRCCPVMGVKRPCRFTLENQCRAQHGCGHQML